MEKYIVKVIIENVSGKIIDKTEFDTHTLAEIKAVDGTNLINQFIETTIQNIADERRENPHHHQNRKD